MSRFECHYPKPHPKIIGLSMPCRKCPPCVKFTRLEWANRMKLECVQAPRPYFCTWTFKPEVYTNSEADCKADIQRFWKKLRKAGHDIRYWTVIERGSQKHRLHGHSVLWSKSLFSMSPMQAYKTLHSVWGNGRIDMQPVRSVAALNYVTKYLVKDLSEEKQRNYSWSQKPMLGTVGRQVWEAQIHHYHEQGVIFDRNNLPPNKIKLPILGEMAEIWIPKSYWVAFCKAIGISFEEEQYETPENWDPLKAEPHGSQPKIYSTSKLYSKARAIKAA